MMHLLLRVLFGIVLFDSFAFAQFDVRYLGLATGSVTSFPTARLEDSSLTKLADVDMYEQLDGTLSWDQPQDTSFNGRCGETAAANIVSMIYRKTSPVTVSRNMSDMTPGTLPKTLSQFLNHFAPGTWSVQNAPFYEAFYVLKRALQKGELKAKNGKAPVATLLQVSAFQLHWVTVVDIDAENNIVYNDSGMQRRESPATFVKKWAFDVISGASGMAIRSTLANACCSAYTFVAQ